MTKVLRPDQFKLKTDIYGCYQDGVRNVLAVLPTGGGKSVVVSDIIKEYDALNNLTAVMAHRNELVGQLSGHMAEQNIKHRIIASAETVSEITAVHRAEYGKSFVNPDARCAVISVDTLNARAEKLKTWCAQVGLWVTDEAHHLLRDNKWGKAAALFPNAYGLGVTASPCRADGMGLGSHADGVFDAMVQGPTMRELIALGALSDYEIALPESDFHIDETKVGKDGDFTRETMRDASKKSHIVGDVVREYMKRAPFKRAICFATDVDTAVEMANKFNSFGIPAAAISAKTPSPVRRDLTKRFRLGSIRVLVNVDLFGEGFDVPAVEVVIMARPTASLAVYLQQFGRALRILLGKSHGLIIDHVSNWKRHGFPDKSHYWTLDRREKRAKKPTDPELIDDLVACKSCTRPYERFYPVCPHCGAAPPLPDATSRTLEQIDGDLTLLDRDRCAAMRAALVLESPGAVASRVAFVAGEIAAKGVANKQMERIAAQARLNDVMATWAGHGRAKGRGDGEIYRRFYIATGVDMQSALMLPRVDMEALAERVEGWQR